MDETNDKIHKTPIMDIKMHNNGKVIEPIYEGQILLITKDEYTKLVRKAEKVASLKKNFSRLEKSYKEKVNTMKKEHEIELAKAKNKTIEANKKTETLNHQMKKKLTEEEKQEAKVTALMNRMGKGRPNKLTEQHKKFIQTNLRQLKKFGGKKTVTDLQEYLTLKMGYTGEYEAVRAYVRKLEKKYKN